MAVVGKRDAYTQIDGRVGACAHLVAVEGGLFHVNPAGFSPSNGKVSPGFQAWAAAGRGRVRGRGAVRGRRLIVLVRRGYREQIFILLFPKAPRVLLHV